MLQSSVVATSQVDHRTIHGGRNEGDRSPCVLQSSVVATSQVDHRTCCTARWSQQVKSITGRAAKHVGRNKPSRSQASAWGRSVRLHTSCFQQAKSQDRGLVYAHQGTGVAQGTDHNDSDTGDPFGSSILCRHLSFSGSGGPVGLSGWEGTRHTRGAGHRTPI